MTSRRALLAGIPAVLLAGIPAYATEPGSTWHDYDQFLRQLPDFSGAVLVAANGHVVLHEGYGYARNTKFCYASMGKMFTAMAIGQLVQRRALAFGDPLARYLTGFPPGITLHHLLTHTAGMGDIFRENPPHTIAEALDRIRAEPLLSEPGARFGYSNSGFVVLGGVIEQVTGVSYADYIATHIFRRAGMKNTAIRVYRPSEIPGMAPPGNGDDRIQIGSPAGGGYTTVEDMLRFAQAVTGYRLLRRELTETVLAGKVILNPLGWKYAYGFLDQTFNGARIVGHNGGNPGYECQLDIHPTTGHVVVVMTNRNGVLMPAMRRSQEIIYPQRDDLTGKGVPGRPGHGPAGHEFYPLRCW